MAYFNIAVDLVLKKEGGLANDKADKGGLTKYGISQRAYPNLNIRDLTLDDAKRIYFVDYWEPIQGDKIQSQALANYALDMAVNHGVTQAIKLLQKGAKVPVDGVLGPITLNKINTSPADTLRSTVQHRIDFYNAIVKKNPSQAKFLKGWLARATDVQIDVAKTASILLPIAIGFLVYFISSNLTKG